MDIKKRKDQERNGDRQCYDQPPEFYVFKQFLHMILVRLSKYKYNNRCLILPKSNNINVKSNLLVV